MTTLSSILEINSSSSNKNNSSKTVFLENFNDLRISNAVQAISRLENAANEVLHESEEFIDSIHESLVDGKWLDRNDTQTWSKRKTRIRQSIGVMKNCGESLVYCLKALRQKEISTCELERENENLFSNLHKAKFEVSVLQRQLRERGEELNEAKRGNSTHMNEVAARDSDMQTVCRSRDLLQKELEGKEKDYERLLTQVRLMNQQLVRCEKEREQMNVELIRGRHQSQLEIEDLKTKLEEIVSQQNIENERSVVATELEHQVEELQEINQRLQFQKTLVESENSLLKSKLSAHLQQRKQDCRFSHLKDGRVVASSYSDDDMETSTSRSHRQKTLKSSQSQVSKFKTDSPTSLIQSTKKSIIVQQSQRDLLYYKDAFLRLSSLMKSVQEEQEKMKDENQRKTEQIMRLEQKLQEKDSQLQKSREEHDHLLRLLREKENEFQNKLQSLQKVKTKEEFDRRELENYLDFIRHSYSVIFKEMSQEV